MMKVDLYHPRLKTNQNMLSTWKFDPKKYGLIRDSTIVYSITQNLTKNVLTREIE